MESTESYSPLGGGGGGGMGGAGERDVVIGFCLKGEHKKLLTVGEGGGRFAEEGDVAGDVDVAGEGGCCDGGGCCRGRGML